MKRTYLSDSVATTIKTYIKEHELKAGAKLPSVSEWMEMLNVGRSTLREGIKKLEAEDLIEIINGKGIFVKQISPIRIYTSLPIQDEKKYLLEALEVRTALEAKAVELAVENVTEDQLKKMEYHLANYEKYCEENDLIMASLEDGEFHKSIYQASGNILLFELISSIHKELYVLWETPYNKATLYNESYPYHLQLLEGIKQKDKKKAITAFHALIESVKQNIINIEQL